MPTIRTVLLNGVALAGCCGGLFSIADGYARNLPEPPERAVAKTWFDPETTTSITPKDETGAKGKRGQRVQASKSKEADAEPSKGWIDPYYRKRTW